MQIAGLDQFKKKNISLKVKRMINKITSLNISRTEYVNKQHLIT